MARLLIVNSTVTHISRRAHLWKDEAVNTCSELFSQRGAFSSARGR